VSPTSTRRATYDPQVNAGHGRAQRPVNVAFGGVQTTVSVDACASPKDDDGTDRRFTER
jgi:hypothetical protein